MSGTMYQDFEQKVKLLGDWLVFLKGKEQEYQTQLDRARRAGGAQAAPEETEVIVESSFFPSSDSGEERADRWV